MLGPCAIACAVVPRYVAGTRGRGVPWGVASDAETELMNFLGGAKGQKVTLVVGGVVITGKVHASDPSPLPGDQVTLTDASLDGSESHDLLSIRLDRIDAWVWNGPRPSEDKAQAGKAAAAKMEKHKRALEQVTGKAGPARRRG